MTESMGRVRKSNGNRPKKTFEETPGDESDSYKKYEGRNE